MSFTLCVTGAYLWLWLPHAPPAVRYLPWWLRWIGGEQFEAFPLPDGLMIRCRYAGAGPWEVEGRVCGIWYQTLAIRSGRITSVEIPAWHLLTTTALLPAAWAGRRLLNRHASHAGRCVRCGYDLRATPDRCPECGTDVVAGPPTNQPLQRTGDASG